MQFIYPITQQIQFLRLRSDIEVLFSQLKVMQQGKSPLSPVNLPENRVATTHHPTEFESCVDFQWE